MAKLRAAETKANMENTNSDTMDVDAQPLNNNAKPPPSSASTTGPTPPPNTDSDKTPPCDADYIPDISRLRLDDSEEQRYLDLVLAKCTNKARLNKPAPGKRDIYAIGRVVVKSDHRAKAPTGDYSVMDENESTAVEVVAKALPDIQLPKCYLRTKVNGRDIIVQSRIFGTTLESLWPNLTKEEKLRYKEQVRDILRRIHQIKGDDSKPSFFVKAGNASAALHGLDQDEYDILFSGDVEDPHGYGVAHNNMALSSIYVIQGRIVGLADWSNSGYFGWERPKKIHSTVLYGDDGNDEEDVSWRDLYDIPVETSDATTMKAETTNPSLETVPRASTSEAPNVGVEHPTPKKVLDLKRDSMSRAGSSERSSPAPSTKGTKKRAIPATKKGSATRKAPAKKRKLNDATSTDGPSRKASATPAPRGGKKQTKGSSVSVAGSPAPGKMGAGGEEDDFDDEDVEDPSQVYCICRKPDNHTWMIGCDECDDWFHGKCVKINQTDADLIEKYVCPLCSERTGEQTTWKRKCRFEDCRQPARGKGKSRSKYCSDEHGREYFLSKVEKAKSNGRGRRKNSQINYNEDEGSNYEDYDDETDDDDSGDYQESRGGVLTRGALKAIISQVDSAEQFRKLGSSILAAQPPEIKAQFGAIDDGNGDVRLDLDSQQRIDQLSPEEQQQMDAVKKEKAELSNQAEMLRDRERFVTLLKQQAKYILERLRQADPKGATAWKDICGFDPRLSWSDEEFDTWRQSDEGKKALEHGFTVGDPGVDESGDTTMADGNEVDLSRIAGSVCIKKRCEQHRQWFKVQQHDIAFEKSNVNSQLAICEKKARGVVDRFMLRIYSDAPKDSDED